MMAVRTTTAISPTPREATLPSSPLDDKSPGRSGGNYRPCPPYPAPEGRLLPDTTSSRCLLSASFERPASRPLGSAHCVHATTRRGTHWNRYGLRRIKSACLGRALRKTCTNGSTRSATSFAVIFGKQSKTNTAGSSSAISLAISGSIRPLPEKPRLMTGRSSQRPSIAVCTMPGRDAQPPCVIEVP